MDSHFQQQKQNIYTNFYLNSTRLYSCFNCIDLVWIADTNACKTQNGRCSQLCLPTGQNQRVCVCTAGYERKNETYCAGEYSIYSWSKKCYFLVWCSLMFLDRNSFLCSLKNFVIFPMFDFKSVFSAKKKKVLIFIYRINFKVEICLKFHFDIEEFFQW